MGWCSATTKAAPQTIPFSCVVCFDEFNTSDRAPVVLPCGHTYVCALCASRLTKCMECREPLFWSPPPPAVPDFSQHYQHTPYRSGISTRSYGRSSYTMQQPHTIPSAASTLTTTTVGTNVGTPSQANRPSVPLPLPRNLLMISLLEASTEASAKEAQDEDDAEFEYDEHQILTGVEFTTGSCGTYVVRPSETPLAVIPFDPRKRRNRTTTQVTTAPREPFPIEERQKLQVVECEDGVYQLARGAGYVVASESQLAKVGAPEERSCQLEGVLGIVERRKEELLSQLHQIEELEGRLKQKISEEQQMAPSRPIISDPPEDEHEVQPPERDGSSTPVSECSDDVTLTPVSPVIVESFVRNQAIEILEPGSPALKYHYQMNDGYDEFNTTSHIRNGNNSVVHTPNTIDNADIHYVDENIRPSTFGCHSEFFRLPAFADYASSSRSFDSVTNANARYVPSMFSEPTTTPAILPSMTTDTLQTSPSMINFSTGMSGHRALLSTKTPSRDQEFHRRIRHMGNHRGIGHMFRAHIRKRTPPSP